MAPPSAAGGGPSGSSSAGGSGKPLLVLSTTGEQEALRKLMAKPIVKVRVVYGRLNGRIDRLFCR